MVTVDQVRQLETRVARIIDHANNLTGENALLKANLDNFTGENALLKANLDNLTGENTLLKANLDSYQKRIDELEVLIQRFKEEQARIEEGIIAALDRLNQFEDDVRKTIETPPLVGTPTAGPSSDKPPVDVPGEDTPLPDDPATETDDEPESELDIF
jgi:chromosome segregation ATPase